LIDQKQTGRTKTTPGYGAMAFILFYQKPIF